MKKQTVVRTGSCFRDEVEIQELHDHLKDGWYVVMCTRIGTKLEYILEFEYTPSMT